MNTFTRTPMEITARASTVARSPGAPESPSHPLSLTTTWKVLRFTFGVVPIVAGVDKYTNFLVNWENYLNPLILRALPLSGHALMEFVGVVEIAAGILTLARPRLGGYIVMAWLICIALSLIAGGRYLDVAVRDLVMAIGAYTLASLTTIITNTNSRRLS